MKLSACDLVRVNLHVNESEYGWRDMIGHECGPARVHGSGRNWIWTQDKLDLGLSGPECDEVWA